MAKKSQAIAILEGKLNLLKADEAEARQALAAVFSQRTTLEDLLKSIRAAAAGSKGGKGRRGSKDSVSIRQAVVESFNKQAGESEEKAFANAERVREAVAAARQQNDSKAS